ncbi:MAG TPA: ribonuclease H [Candidatus Lumbricidophila sp.]|nr:ribonuclease H [Candidatus Lumbricidophila sp.]
MIIAAADGSALGNPGPAGWAWYVSDDCWAAGGWPNATNNQGELQAVIDLLGATAHVDDELHILCDSIYVINTATKWMQGWKRKGWRKADGAPVLNLEMVQALDRALTGRRVRFEWVKGHAGHELNEAADLRARAAAAAYQQGTAVPTGPGFVDASGLTPARAAAASGAARGSSVITAHTLPAAIQVPVAAKPLPPEDSLDPAPADATLFDFNDEASEWTTLTLDLSIDEHARLVGRARDAGVSPEAYLRSLI